VSTLGGHNLAIGTNAANKGTAADFIKFMSSKEVAKADTLATGQAHVNRALYSDPDILKKFPHFPILLKSIETAKPRPKVVNYGDATLAMQDPRPAPCRVRSLQTLRSATCRASSNRSRSSRQTDRCVGSAPRTQG
jgi:ABC-type glycerol-3-phosphate transport system substrate-binding protein